MGTRANAGLGRRLSPLLGLASDGTAFQGAGDMGLEPLPVDRAIFMEGQEHRGLQFGRTVGTIGGTRRVFSRLTYSAKA